MRVRLGDKVRVRHGLGKGEVVFVERVDPLPMGDGILVFLPGENGHYPAILNPADLEVLERAVTITLPCRVWDYWAETFAGDVPDEIRGMAIRQYEQDAEDVQR